MTVTKEEQEAHRLALRAKGEGRYWGNQRDAYDEPPSKERYMGGPLENRRECKGCGVFFQPKNPKRLYCSYPCAQRSHRLRMELRKREREGPPTDNIDALERALLILKMEAPVEVADEVERRAKKVIRQLRALLEGA